MAKILNIIINPNPILRRKSKPFASAEIKSRHWQDFARNLAKTMVAKDGVGLAAPQVGKNKRLIAVNTKEGVMVMFNPRLKKKSWRQEWGSEGCLSVPGVFGQVKRSRKIICEYQDQSGHKQILTANGLLARVIQHEIDHLDGILFIDKAKEIKKEETI